MIGKIVMLCGCLWGSMALATEAKSLRFTVAPSQVDPLQLAVAQMPLLEAVTTLAKTTGVTVHYANLADKVVSKTCVASSVKQLFECLLDNEADMAFRYGQTALADGKPWLAEMWVLGTALAGGSAGSNTEAAKLKSDTGQSGDPLQQILAGLDVNKLLADAQSQDPTSRADAIAALAMLDKAQNPLVRKTLQTALADKVASVRAQAVFGLGKYPDTEALAGLESALQDNDVSVRLMVVDAADAHPELLQMALDDSDTTVRSYAANKLENLAQSN